MRNTSQDKDSSIRQAAVEALGKLQPFDAPSLTLLHNDFKDQDWDVRQAAVKALAKIPTEQLIDSY